MIRKFVRWDVPPLETHKGSTMYRLHEALEQEQELSRDDKNLLVFTASDPVYKVMGYAYDFRPFLSTFWVKVRYYGIVEMYAWDKTAIRKSGKYTGIIQIVEVPEGD